MYMLIKNPIIMNFIFKRIWLRCLKELDNVEKAVYCS